MTFELILAELVNEANRRIRNGHITERGLARRAAVSQPHMHHVLNGKRGLTPAVADRMLGALALTLSDLVQAARDKASPGPRDQIRESTVLVPLLEGLLAPGHRAPVLQLLPAYLPVPAAFLPPDPDLMAVRLGADPAIGPLFHEGDLVVVSRELRPMGPAGVDDIVTVKERGGEWMIDIPPTPWWDRQFPDTAQREALRVRYASEGKLVGTVILLLRGMRPMQFLLSGAGSGRSFF